MTTEQEKTVKALQTAIQMEIDGKAYYLEASRKSGNEMGRKLLASLAAEEDIHRAVFEKIYKPNAVPSTDSSSSNQDPHDPLELWTLSK